MSQLGGSVVTVEVKKTQSVGCKRQSLYKNQVFNTEGHVKVLNINPKQLDAKRTMGTKNTREFHLEGSKAAQTTQHL